MRGRHCHTKNYSQYSFSVCRSGSFDNVPADTLKFLVFPRRIGIPTSALELSSSFLPAT
jgi:hypothetical protein